MSEYILPVVIVVMLLVCVFKKINAYECFCEGAKSSMNLVVSIFPYICAIFLAVALFKASGLSNNLTEWLRPVLSAIGMPPELCDLMIIKVLSGNGAIALLEEIFARFGADSYIGRCASVILASSETIFYIAAVYISTSHIKKLNGAIAISLVASVVGAIFACLICRLM